MNVFQDGVALNHCKKVKTEYHVNANKKQLTAN